MFITLQSIRILPGTHSVLLDWFSLASHCLQRHSAVISVRLLAPLDGSEEYVLQIIWRNIEGSSEALNDPEFVESLVRIPPICVDKQLPRTYQMLT